MLRSRERIPSSSGGVPRAPGGLPLVGHGARLLRDPLGFLSSLPRHGDLVRVRIGPSWVVVICDPGLARQALLNDRAFDKGGPLVSRAREIIGNGLLTCPHHDHRRQRRLIQPAFHRDRMPGYAHVMSAQVADAIEGWAEGQVIDVPDAMYAIAATITVEAMFSSGLPRAEVRTAIGDLTTVVRGMLPRMLMPAAAGHLPTPGNLRYRQASARLREVVDGIIARRRAGGADHGDMLSAVLAACDVDGEAEGEGLSDAEVTDQVLTIFGAGTETTAGTMAWALHLLALHPEAERRVHEEVDATLAGAPAAPEHLPGLAATGNVVTEALRLYPPVWIATRTLTSGMELGGHRFPSGTVFAYSPYLLHHRADLYPDPERFDPARWGESAPQPPRNAYVPFGAGARKCIGDQFGIMEATLALATIAGRWRLEHLPGPAIRPVPGITLSPRGLRMRVLARD
ncbi:cytochrome P450 [Spirillospora sp. NPDC029432]|uniref:cytochrome P450 n=1 Tax=Spirillospora sp. NPDC029432 TaxID=3154599 RepID=UPI003453925D